MSKTLKELLLSAPDCELDSKMFALIEKWDEPEPTSLQLLEVIDWCIYGSLCSGVALMAMQIEYDRALRREDKCYQDNLPYASWRNECS